MKRLREIAPALAVVLRVLVLGTCPNASIGYLINFPADSAVDCDSDALNGHEDHCGYHRR